MSTTTYHRDNLRATLLDLAGETVRESGVDAVSLRQLARAAGVSHAAPARHFRDRQALLDELALHGFTRLNAAMTDAATAPGVFTDRFRATVLAYLRFALENAELLGLMYRSKHAEGARDDLVAAGHAGMAAAVALIAEGQRDGAVIDGDPERLARVAFASVHGLAALAIGGLLDGTPVDDAAADTVDLLLRALAAR